MQSMIALAGTRHARQAGMALRRADACVFRSLMHPQPARASHGARARGPACFIVAPPAAKAGVLQPAQPRRAGAGPSCARAARARAPPRPPGLRAYSPTSVRTASRMRRSAPVQCAALRPALFIFLKVSLMRVMTISAATSPSRGTSAASPPAAGPGAAGAARGAAGAAELQPSSPSSFPPPPPLPSPSLPLPLSSSPPLRPSSSSPLPSSSSPPPPPLSPLPPLHIG